MRVDHDAGLAPTAGDDLVNPGPGVIAWKVSAGDVGSVADVGTVADTIVATAAMIAAR